MKKMKLYARATEETIVYQDADLRGNQAIECAKTMWRDRCKTYLDTNGDQGTCVLGAGIYVYYLAPRCRAPRPHTIIWVTDVCFAQGSLVWEDSVKEVLGYLRAQGIEARYDAGRMD